VVAGSAIAALLLPSHDRRVVYHWQRQYRWLAGGGIEWAFAENWSARVEYDFLGLNDRTLTVPLGVPVIGGDVFTLHNRNVQMATFGVNYRLNWFFNNPSNAVATRY
jgi:hypothetical protein